MKIEQGFPDSDRAAIAEMYWDAFGPKLGRVLGPRQRALDFVAIALDPSHALCARAADGALLGVAGFKTMHGTLVGGASRDMIRAYGPVGAVWRIALLALISRDVDNDRFLMDGIFVARHARGTGVGSRLLEAIAQEARARGYAEVRLDVIDENIRARSLYERRGFHPVGHQSTGPLRYMFGFRSATTMVRRIG